MLCIHRHKKSDKNNSLFNDRASSPEKNIREKKSILSIQRPWAGQRNPSSRMYYSPYMGTWVIKGAVFSRRVKQQ